jgi:hypothetical protein
MWLVAAEMLGTHPCHFSVDCGSNEALGIIRLLQLCPHPIVILISPESSGHLFSLVVLYFNRLPQRTLTCSIP